MNILIVNQTRPLFEKLQNLLSDSGNRIVSVDSMTQIATTLNNRNIDLVLMEVNSLSDVALLEFINTNYRDVAVQLVVDHTVQHLITTLKEGNYSIFQ